RAVQGRRPPPRVPAPEGLLNRGVDVVLRRQRNARDDVAGGGIRVLQPVRGLCRAPPTADIVLQIPIVRLHLRKQRGGSDHQRPSGGLPRQAQLEAVLVEIQCLPRERQR